MSKIKEFPVYERAVEEVISFFGRHNSSLRLTGTRYGLTYAGWDYKILEDLHEFAFGTARCERPRAFDAHVRLKQCEEIDEGLK